MEQLEQYQSMMLANGVKPPYTLIPAGVFQDPKTEKKRKRKLSALSEVKKLAA